ncbi:MAG: AMP-binding protein [Pseudomonadales bacterium]|nr:AMP-binding protein [Pseudomonadales bacterium]
MSKTTRKEALALLTAAGQDYEIKEQSIDGLPIRTFANAPSSLKQLFADAVSDETFYVFGDERYTFAEIYTLSARLAVQLQQRYNVSKGDRVAISMRNYPEWVAAFMASTSIGAVAVAMNAWWGADEIAQGLDDCGAVVMLADQERLDRLAQIDNLQTEIIAVRPTASDHVGTEFQTLMDDIPSDVVMPEVAIDSEDPATIFYTSGSTGFPKGAVASHRNILSALLSWELDQTSAMLINGTEPPVLDYQSATLLAVPLFHVTGSHAIYLSSYRAQRKVVAMYKWDPDQASDLIESEQISSFIAPAAMTGDLVQAATRTNRNLATLLSVGGGGAPRAPEQVKDIDDAFSGALPGTGWGMTETNAIGTGIGGQDYLDRPASSGRVSAVLDLRVVDEAGVELPQGERGELQIRGASVIKGYWRRPEANAETFHEGWLKTGDVAYFDEEGFVFIVDRIKDLIIRGGENIGCGEVEAALLEHPLIHEACVYAVPDTRLGEEVASTVYADVKISEDELRGFLSERLAKFKIPKYLQFTDEHLPRIASGKIFKRQLRDDTVASLSDPSVG